MKTNKQLFLFVASGTFSTLPPVKQFFIYFKNKFDTGVIESTINNYENFFKSCTFKMETIKFNNYTDYSNQSILTKILKYIELIYKLLTLKTTKFSKYNKVYIYTNELFALWISIVLKAKNNFIIYHQFEIVIPEEINILDKFYLHRIIKNFNKVDIALVPEVNRLKYFQEEVIKVGHNDQYFLIPNTNNNQFRIDSKISEKITISHIGAFGEKHCLNSIISAILTLPEEKYDFIFVGNLAEEVNEKLKNLNRTNVLILGQLKHYELEEIYKKTDIGLILYDDSSLHTKYCAPNKLFEYWSYGIPVIANCLPGLISVYNHKCLGKLIDLDDVNLFVSTIIELEKNVETARKEIQHIFNKEYKLDIYMQKLEEIFNKI